MSKLLRKALRAMQDHDCNDEGKYHQLSKNTYFACGWTWLSWMFGLSIWLDPGDRLAIWVDFGPIRAGFYRE